MKIYKTDMDCKMEILTLILCVVPTIVSSITIVSNGNSPEVKLKGGMMVDLHKGFVPVTSKFKESTVNSIENDKSRSGNYSKKLSINERYRRLIPYMTFYYANDLATPTTSSPLDVEVEKAQIVQELHQTEQRQPKKIIYSHRNIPRYQGNRLTQHNIASANPTKLYYKSPPVYQRPNKVTQNYNALSPYKVILPNDFDSSRFIPKQAQKTPSVIFATSPRKPYLNLYNDGTPNIRYYLSEKEDTPKYKLVPYEQTPPIQIPPQNENQYDITQKPVPVSVLIPKEQVYVKPRPARPQYVYENVYIQPTPFRKQPAIVSESYYEKQRPASLSAQPIIHGGFKPIVKGSVFTTEAPVYTSSIPDTITYDIDQTNEHETNIESAPTSDFRPNYYEYIIEPTTTYKPQPVTSSNTVSLASLLDSLQLNKSIPKPITKQNVGSSIRTLLQVLNALKAAPQDDDFVQAPVLKDPKPFVAPKVVIEVPIKPASPTVEPPSQVNSEDLHREPYLVQVNTPSQHLDDNPSNGGTSQRFPPPVTSDDEGGTPGQPDVDYPILTTIPQTSFNCKSQRYKGFFADTETRCQVWHYCDLNGGQASFLCPNGTIFSQAALTCDWWFNVRCASTTQLYVINESLYKYILPHSPKFPEDYSGPLVDKYLTLKFKEMEEQFKKNKNKQSASDKMDGDGEDEDEVEDSSSEDTEAENKSQDGGTTVSEASVIVESPGTSGNVERLEE